MDVKERGHGLERHAGTNPPVGDCSLAGRRARPISREQAVRALTEDLEPCTL
ncbi:DUF6233 domain-containing protein [Streptomyces noursei]